MTSFWPLASNRSFFSAELPLSPSSIPLAGNLHDSNQDAEEKTVRAAQQKEGRAWEGQTENSTKGLGTRPMRLFNSEALPWYYYPFCCLVVSQQFNINPYSFLDSNHLLSRLYGFS